MNKTRTFGSLICIAVVASVSGRAAATCARGTPDVNRVLAQSVSDLSEFNDWFRTNLSLAADKGWDFTRGTNDPLNTDFEYNKLLLAGMVLMSGIDNTEPVVALDPITGKYGYEPDSLRLNRAFHRSGDEWGYLVGDGPWTVCDRVNPDTGAFDCPKSGIWPFEGYSTFGADTRSGISDFVPARFEGTAPDAKGVLWFSSTPNESYLLCTAFEDDAGGVDPLVVPSLVDTLARLGWLSLQQVRGKHNLRSFNWGVSGVEHEAIARDAIDRDVGLVQTAQQALCDVIEAHQSWVPLMVVEAFNFAWLHEAEEPRFDNTDSFIGKSPYQCGPPTDSLVLEPGVDHCANGSLACNSDAICDDGDNLTDDDCNQQGCCENENLH